MEFAVDTIFALASGRGAAGVAVIRISGPGAEAALVALGGGHPAARVATLVTLREPAGGGVLDRALALGFSAPASFTGEDVVELHVHGGRAVIEAVMKALGALPGLRPAEPGEFARRAFANGKMDLAEAEALADLVAAETEAQRRQAQAQYSGALSAKFEGWRSAVLGALAEVETAVDFADEDVPKELVAKSKHTTSNLINEIKRYMDDGEVGERLRDGFHITIVGVPNVGKSSLLNALARRDAAIVSETEGTTRDVIEVHLDLGGIPVILADTAGLRRTGDAIEAEGARRAVDRATAADLRLALFDARGWPARDAETARFLGPGTIVVVNKSDLIADTKQDDIIAVSKQELPLVYVSAKTGVGLDRLLAAIANDLSARLERIGPAPMTRERHRRALADALEALERALGLPDPVARPELVAEELRLAARALGRIAGHVDVEDVLDRIFSQFCIGK